jgi:hypothetical protein
MFKLTPLPTNPQIILPNTSIVLVPTGEPIIVQYTVTPYIFTWGKNCSYSAISSTPFNFGIYGPNPTNIGPRFGRMQAPKVNIYSWYILYCFLCWR